MDLFSYRSNKKTRKLSSRQLFQHALDCHQAVVELSAKLESLLEAHKKSMEGNRANSRLLRKHKFKLADQLISPGTTLKGSIEIPPESFSDASEDEEHRRTNLDPNFNNMSQEGKRPYELQVLRQLKDERGEVYWVGRHQTYDGRRDKQSVVMRMMSDDGIVYFEDYETHLEGRVDEPNHVSGVVQQLKRGEPGFFVARRGKDYKFELYRAEDSKIEQINAVRSKVQQARAARALAFAAWCGSASSSRVSGEKFTGLQVDWVSVYVCVLKVC